MNAPSRGGGRGAFIRRGRLQEVSEKQWFWQNNAFDTTTKSFNLESHFPMIF